MTMLSDRPMVTVAAGSVSGAERAWGTPREDYSADGDAWSFFPHENAARSRVPVETKTAWPG